MLSATQLGTYTNFTQKQEANTLAILHVPNAILATCRTASYRTWSTYAAGDYVNAPTCTKLTSRIRPRETSLAI